MGAKICSDPQEQARREHRRFLARQRPKPVLGDKIKAREERARKKDGSERVFTDDLN